MKGWVVQSKFRKKSGLKVFSVIAEGVRITNSNSKMSGGGDSFTLRECLVDFLKGRITEMPKIEARIISLSPLLVTDDNEYSLELPGLASQVAVLVAASSKKSSNGHRLILLDWNYSLKKQSQNSQELYIDIDAESIRVESLFPSQAQNINKSPLPSLCSNPIIKQLFEAKKRQIMEGKPSVNKYSLGSVNAFGLPIEQEDDFIGIQDILNVPNPEGQEAEPQDRYTYVAQRRSTPEKQAQRYREVEMSPLHNRSAEQALRHLEPSNENSPVLGKRTLGTDLTLSSNENLPKKQIKLADIMEGFRKGKITWKEITFNKETVEYLQKNLHTLLQEN